MIFKNSLYNTSNSHYSIFSNKITAKILDIVWPIKRQELSKFLLITLLLFCILFIQNIARVLKDGIVTTMIGAEIISFLKLWGVLPAAIGMSALYVKLTNTLKAENIFYVILSCFIIFFAAFAFFIFPNYQNLHSDPLKVAKIIMRWPHLKWFILLISNWSFSLFYIIVELWPNIVFSLLFWQFVNSITSVEQSKRFYVLFGLLGQTGLYFSGEFLQRLPIITNYLIKNHYSNSTNTILCTQLILSVVILLGIVILLVFWLLNHRILDKQTLENLKFSGKKKKLSLKESLKMIITSKYICLITLLLISYGLAVTLAESPWKDKVGKVSNSIEEYTAFIGSYLKYSGIITIIFVIIGSNIIRRLGWLPTAIITPIIIFTMGTLFFSVTSSDYIAQILSTLLGTDPLTIAVLIGAIQNILTKSSKYTLFDSTKEMSYVPLDPEIKTKGKATADILGIKVGKSLGALMQSIIFITIPNSTYQSISLYLMIAFIVACTLLFWSVYNLGREYNAIVK